MVRAREPAAARRTAVGSVRATTRAECNGACATRRRAARAGPPYQGVDLDSVSQRVSLQPRMDPRVLIRQPSGVRTNVSK